ncbi:hypothetical protein V8C35DRAFT_281250 [Trichoderma chlorosporum]
MGRRGGSSDGTFYFQAWHVGKVVSGESWAQNKGIADFVEQHLSPETKKWLYIKGCVPTKEKPGLLVPYTLCVKLRAPKSGQDPKDAEQALFQFRNKEYPDIAKTYFTTKLNKSLDFFNSYAEGADFDSPLANFDTVKSSKKLRERVKSAIKKVKKDFWGDIVHGLVDGVSSKSEFKAARFIRRRGKGMYQVIDMYQAVDGSDVVDICLDFSDPASDPNILPPTPLQNPLPLPHTSFAPLIQEPDLSVPVQEPDVSPPVQEPEVAGRPRKTSDSSDFTATSTDAPGTDASSVRSVETAQSSIVDEESSSAEVEDVKESSSEVQNANGSSTEAQDVNESSSESQDAKEPPSESSIALEEEASTSPADEETAATAATGDSTTDAEADAAVDSTEEVEVDNIADSSADVDADNTVDSAADADADDTVDDTVDSAADVDVDDTVDSSEDVKLDDAAESFEDAEADATIDSTAEAEVDDVADSSEDVKVDDAADSSEDAEVDNTADSSADIDADDTVDDTANSTADVEVDDTVDTSEDAEVDDSVDVTAADSSEESYQETAMETTNSASSRTAVIAPSSGVVATRRKMNCVPSQTAQTAYFVVQNSGNWLRYLMASQGQSTQKLRSTFFDSPIILAAPPQVLTPDGMMRVYFMSQAKKQQDEVVRDEKGRAIHTRKGDKSEQEWVVGTAKVSTHAFTMHLGKQLENKNARLLQAASPAVREVDSVVGPNNRLIEMTDAPGIPQAILVTTPHPVEDVREGDIVQEERDDGFVHIETNILDRHIEEVVSDDVEEMVSDNVDDADKKVQEEGEASKAERKSRAKGKLPITKKKPKAKRVTKGDRKTNTGTGARVDVKSDVAVDADSVPPRKPSKVYTPSFSRKSWRDVEPQEPQVIYDVMSGYNFLQVEDVQVFSFSTTSHDMMLRTTPAAPAAVDEGEGIGVWSPPVVGIFSWMWDYLAPGGRPQAATAH